MTAADYLHTKEPYGNEKIFNNDQYNWGLYSEFHGIIKHENILYYYDNARM